MVDMNLLRQQVKEMSDEQLQNWADVGSSQKKAAAARELADREKTKADTIEHERHSETINVQSTANTIAKRANLISWLAFGLSIIAILISLATK